MRKAPLNPEDTLLHLLLSGGTGGPGGPATDHGQGGDGGIGQGARIIDHLITHNLTININFEHTLLRGLLLGIKRSCLGHRKAIPGSSTTPRNLCMIAWCKKHPDGFLSEFKLYWAQVENSDAIERWKQVSADAAASKLPKERKARRSVKGSKERKATPGSSTTPRNLCMVAWCKTNPGGFLSQFKLYWARVENSDEIKRWKQASVDAVACKIKVLSLHALNVPN